MPDRGLRAEGSERVGLRDGRLKVIRKPFSIAELILAVRLTLKRSAKLRFESRGLRKYNEQLRTELEEAIQKSITEVKRSIEGLRIS